MMHKKYCKAKSPLFNADFNFKSASKAPNFAVIVRQRCPMRRPYGTMVYFEDNAVVITTETGETKGTDIKGPVAREAAERWPRVSATANTIV